MASIEGTNNGDTFPAVNPTRELNLGVPEEFPVDPISSDVATAKELKEESEERAKAVAKEVKECKCPFAGVFMSTLTVTVVIGIAVGVAFVVTKKMKQT